MSIQNKKGYCNATSYPPPSLMIICYCFTQDTLILNSGVDRGIAPRILVIVPQPFSPTELQEDFP